MSDMPIWNLPGDHQFWYTDPSYHYPFTCSLPVATVPLGTAPLDSQDANGIDFELGSQYDGDPGASETNNGMSNTEWNLLAYGVQIWSALCRPAPPIAGNTYTSGADGFGAVSVGTPV